MARYRFRQDERTRCTLTGKTFWVTVGGLEFRVDSTTTTNRQGGKRFYQAWVPGEDGTYAFGFGRAEIEDAIDAVVASRAN